MRVHRTILGMIFLVMGTWSLAVYSQDRAAVDEQAADTARGETPAVTLEEFRAAMMEWAIVSERAYRTGDDLAVKIENLTDEQMQSWLDLLPDPESFLESMRGVIEQQEELREEGARPPGAFMPDPQSPAPPLTTPFPPDYPPATGAYADTVLNAISSYGITASNTNRCDATQWGDYVGVWWPLNTTFDVLDGACVVAGCDPIGIACGITCGILEAAKTALKIAAVPLEACDVHQSAIDGAELEAAYENTLGLVGDIAHLHTDLGDHDANIDGDLAAHDANIDGDLAAHDANIDGDLAAHDANIDGDLITHDVTMKAALSAHDANIDGDLQQHDQDIKAVIGDVQDTLDEKVELRLVHMQVLEIVERDRYLVATTESGLPVSVSFESIEYYDPNSTAFLNLATASVTEVEPGTYELRLNLPARNPGYIFRLRVRHDEKYDHFGEILFHWDMEGFTN